MVARRRRGGYTMSHTRAQLVSKALLSCVNHFLTAQRALWPVLNIINIS